MLDVPCGRLFVTVLFILRTLYFEKHLEDGLEVLAISLTETNPMHVTVKDFVFNNVRCYKVDNYQLIGQNVSTVRDLHVSVDVSVL